MKKMYRSKYEMDTMIKKLVSYCPSLDVYVPPNPIDKRKTTRARNQKKVIDRFLIDIDWSSKIDNIYDTLESKGDSFYHFYFENAQSKALKFKYLDPAKMRNIIKDDNGKVICYKYVEHLTATSISANGTITTNYTREVTWLYEIGKVTKIDPLWTQDDKDKWIPVTDAKGIPEVSRTVIINRPSYIDEIAIMRIPSYLREDAEFSDIPASFYSEHCLVLDFLNSNIQQILLMLGFPMILLINGKMVGGERRPGGVIKITNLNESQMHEAKVVDVQIKNGLDPLFNFLSGWDDSLREIVGLVPVSLQRELGKSDSSRVAKQMLAPMENKIDRYVNNILTAMRLPIKVQLKEYNLYDEESDFGTTLAKPVFISATSEFDKQIHDQNELNKKGKTTDELALRNGDTYDEIDARNEKEIADTTLNNEANAQVRSSNNIG